jgi:hypothetical protein
LNDIKEIFENKNMTKIIPDWYLLRRDFIENTLEEYLTHYFQKE